MRASTISALVLGLTTLGASGPARASLADGLVGYWKLDEATNEPASDASGRGHHGTYVNGPATSTRVPALAYPNLHSVAFVRASHQAVRVAAMPAALKPAAVTISVWYAATSTDTDRAELVSGGDSYILYLTKTGLGAGRRQAGSWSDVVATAGGLLDGKWHHVAATIDGAKLEVFVDGEEAALVPTAGPIVYDLGPDLWLGRYGNGGMPRDFEGDLDEVAIYDRVLAPAEIAELAHGAQPGGTVVAKPDAGTDAGNPSDAGVPPADASAADATETPAAPDAPAVPEVAPATDAAAAPDVVSPPPTSSVDAAPPSPVPPAVDAATIPTSDPGRPTAHLSLASAGAVAGGAPGLAGLLALASLLALSETRRRARPSRR